MSYRPNSVTSPPPNGFTLIESMVAMVLIAGFGMAVFSWVNGSLITLQRIQDATIREEAIRNGLEYVSTINPMTAPNGAATLGDFRLSWIAQAETPLQDGVGYPYGISRFQVALYTVQIEMVHLHTNKIVSFSAKQVGYKNVRELALPF